MDELPDDVNYDKIEEGLLLGNLTAALDKETLEKCKISHILTVDSKPLPQEILDIPGLSFHYIEVDDMAEADLLTKFDDSFRFLQDGQQKGNVLVHCYFGVSRSSTIVIAYFMKKYEITLDAAFERVKEKRRFAFPNEGFMSQLLLYQGMGNTFDQNRISYKISQTAIALNEFKDVRWFDVEKYNHLIESNDSCQFNKRMLISCKNCRYELCKSSNVLPHMPGETPDSADEYWSKEVNVGTLCIKGLFTFPCEWMLDEITSNTQGKFSCPKCAQKIGSFNWISDKTKREKLTEFSCPCGALIQPGFFLIPSKLDVRYFEK